MRRILIAALIITACTDATKPATVGLSFSVVSGDGQTGTVGTTLAQPLVIRATDAKGRAIRNLAVDFRVTSGGGSASLATATTNNQGFAQTSWTLGTSTAVPQQLEARAVSSGEILGAFTATALAGPATGLIKVAGDSQTAPRQTAVAIRPAVRVVDQYGNPVPGRSITFTIVGGGGSFTGNPATSGADGIASVQWILGAPVGEQHMSAVLPATAIVPFMANATLESGARMARYAGDNQVAQVNTTLPIRLAVRITDATGAPISGAQPQFSFVQGGGSIGASLPDADTNGVAAVNFVTLCCARGVYRLRATLAGSPDTVFFTETGTPANPVSIAVQAGNGQTAATGRAVPIAPAAIVRDTFNNPVPGVSVDFVVPAGGGSVTGSPATTDTNGIATVDSWTLGASPGSNGLSATASGVPGAAAFTATGVTPVVAATKSTVAVSPISIVASAGEITSTITVTARDTNSSPVAGATVTITVSGTGNTITQPTAVTDANGVTTGAVSSTVAEYKHVWATINGRTTYPAQLEVSGGPPVSMVVYAGDNQIATVGTPVPLNPQVLVRDQFGNGSHGTIVTWEPATGGGSMGFVESPGVFPSGVATSGTWTLGPVAGPNTLRASIAGTPLEVTFHATAVSEFWEPLGSMPVGRWLLSAAAVNGLVYAIGGANFNYEATVQAYDPATNSWSPRASMSGPRGQFGVGVVDGKIYVVGGTSSGLDALGSVEAYDPATDTWTPRAPLPTPRMDVAVAVVNGILYAIGGTHSDSTCTPTPDDGCFRTVGTVEAYDPATDTWTPRTPAPSPRAAFGAVAVNGVIYVVGGANFSPPFSFETHWVAQTEAYDPATNTWSVRAPIPTRRYAPAVGLIDGVIYVAGGEAQDGSSINATNVLESYDPATNQWTPRLNMPGANAWMGAAVLNGLFYTMGASSAGMDQFQAYHSR